MPRSGMRASPKYSNLLCKKSTRFDTSGADITYVKFVFNSSRNQCEIDRVDAFHGRRIISNAEILTSPNRPHRNRGCQGGPPRFSRISTAKLRDLHSLYRTFPARSKSQHGFRCIKASKVCGRRSCASAIPQTGTCTAESTTGRSQGIASTITSYICACTCTCAVKESSSRLRITRTKVPL